MFKRFSIFLSKKVFKRYQRVTQLIGNTSVLLLALKQNIIIEKYIFWPKNLPANVNIQTISVIRTIIALTGNEHFTLLKKYIYIH